MTKEPSMTIALLTALAIGEVFVGTVPVIRPIDEVDRAVGALAHQG